MVLFYVLADAYHNGQAVMRDQEVAEAPKILEERRPEPAVPAIEEDVALEPNAPAGWYGYLPCARTCRGDT